MKGASTRCSRRPTASPTTCRWTPRRRRPCAPGDLVLFGTRPELAVRPMDRRIAETAREAGGVYALDRASTRVTVRAWRVGCASLSAKGLSRPKGRDRWTVPGRLDREAREPAADGAPARAPMGPEAASLARCRRPATGVPSGSTKWSDAPLARWGFGAEVARALDQRREALRAPRHCARRPS